MRLLALLLVIGIVDGSTVNVPDDSLSNLEVSQEPKIALNLTKGYRTKRCERFDKLWTENTYEYKVPKKSFCSDTCGLFGYAYQNPYWFQCKEKIMPDIHFFFSNNVTCHVRSEKGIKDPNNAACIKEVSEFLNKSSTNDVFTNKLVYITHGFGEGLEKRYLNRNWMIELKNSTLQRYAWENGDTVVVGIVSWEIGANMKPQQQEIEGQNMPQMGEKYKSLICCHPRSLPWKPLILPLNYGVASANTWAVGNILAYVNRKISLAFTTKSYTTSCIGHSLGAQVCGFFGKMSKKLVPKITVDKIIGLDPAGPIFDLKEQHISLRLNKYDASNVEIFHTNSLLYGYRNPIGDVDFYINGGNYQYGKPGRIARYKDAVTVRSHSMPVDLLISINIIYFHCFANWKCSITDGYELVDITTEDRPALESKSCFKASSNVTLGDLDALNTNLTGIYWIDVASNSTTCPYDRGSFKCADEGEECKCTGSVKYGSGSKWTSERYTDKDTVSCTNEVFGDPKPFTRKECRCTPAIADNITNSEYLPTPNMERLYDFQSEIIIGIKGLTIMKNNAFQPSDPNMDINIMLAAEVKIQSYPDHTMRIKIDNPTFYLLEEENVLNNGSKMIETRTKTFGSSVHVKPQFQKYLTDPMVVLMKGKSFRSLIVSKMEPDNITKMKTYLVQELRSNGLSPSLRLLNTSGISEPLKIPDQPTKIKL